MSGSLDDRTDLERAEAVIAWVLGSGKGFGDVLTFQEICGAATMPFWRQSNDIREYERLNMKFVAMIALAKGILLTHSKLALRSVRGVGFDIVPAHEQADWARSEANHTIRKALAQAELRIRNTRVDALNAEQRAHHANVAARADALSEIARAEMRRR